MSKTTTYNVSGILKGVNWLQVREEEGLVRQTTFFSGDFHELVEIVDEYRHLKDPWVEIYDESEVEFSGYRPITDAEKQAIEKSKRKDKQKTFNAKQKQIEAAQKLLKEEGLL